MIAQLTSAPQLRAAARELTTPFSVVLEDGSPLTMIRLLRVLPGKRLVGEARLNNMPVLAKLFIAKASQRHWQREHRGITALLNNGLPTPTLLASTNLQGGGHVVATHFLEHATALSEHWRRANERFARLALLEPVLGLLARLHRAGIVYDDPHLDNFLQHAGQFYVVDGAAVRNPNAAGKPLSPTTASSNLALFLAQFPPGWDNHIPGLLAIYQHSNPLKIELKTLIASVRQQRHQRLDDYLAKSLRDCSAFAVHCSPRFFRVVVREQAAALAPILAAPDQAIDQGTFLKNGVSTTAARIDHPELGPLVIKRYNIKGVLHRLQRLLRPSRACNAWRAGLMLQFLDLGTPQPLAMMEERCGPLRGRAWLIYRYCDGPDLLQHLQPERPPTSQEATALQTLFVSMHRERISHIDLKACNLLWHDNQLILIDLDTLRRFRHPQAFKRAWRRGRQRLLRNWPADSVLVQWLDKHLPPAL